MTQRIVLADDRTVAPEDLGAPPSLSSERGWLAVLGVSAEGVVDLARCGSAAGDVLSRIVLPALRLPVGREIKRVSSNLSPTGFSIGVNVLLHADAEEWSAIEAEEAAFERAETRNAMRTRHGRPTTPPPARRVQPVVDGFPKIPPLPEAWELWCGLQSSLGHFCVAFPKSVEALAERISGAAAASGLRCERLRSAAEIPVW